MHISEGVLTPYILSGAALLSAAGIAFGLRRLEPEKLVTVALLSAAFFVASLIHIPIGLSSSHLILNGLLGVLLGWAAFPAIFIALLLQALLFQFGGLTTLGVNTLNMALPSALCFILFRSALVATHSNYTKRTKKSLSIVSFVCGFLAVCLSALMTSGTLALNGEGFIAAAQLMFISSLPVMVVEGLITTCIVSFLLKVRPEMFNLQTFKATKAETPSGALQNEMKQAETTPLSLANYASSPKTDKLDTYNMSAQTH